MNCRASVEAELRKAPGTHGVRVELDSQTATVVFDPATTTLDALRDAVRRAGSNADVAGVGDGTE